MRACSLQAVSGSIALVGTLAYVLCFACGVGPVPGVLVSEINPGPIRGAPLRCKPCAKSPHKPSIWLCGAVPSTTCPYLLLLIWRWYVTLSVQILKISIYFTHSRRDVQYIGSVVADEDTLTAGQHNFTLPASLPEPVG